MEFTFDGVRKMFYDFHAKGVRFSVKGKLYFLSEAFSSTDEIVLSEPKNEVSLVYNRKNNPTATLAGVFIYLMESNSEMVKDSIIPMKPALDGAFDVNNPSYERVKNPREYAQVNKPLTKVIPDYN